MRGESSPETNWCHSKVNGWVLLEGIKIRVPSFWGSPLFRHLAQVLLIVTVATTRAELTYVRVRADYGAGFITISLLPILSSDPLPPWNHSQTIFHPGKWTISQPPVTLGGGRQCGKNNYKLLGIMGQLLFGEVLESNKSLCADKQKKF